MFNKPMPKVIYESLLKIYAFADGREVCIITVGMSSATSIKVSNTSKEYEKTGDTIKLYISGYSMREALENAVTAIDKLSK